jgi:hypothetical protein
VTFISLGYNPVQTVKFYQMLGTKVSVISSEHRISEKLIFIEKTFVLFSKSNLDSLPSINRLPFIYDSTADVGRGNNTRITNLIMPSVNNLS